MIFREKMNLLRSALQKVIRCGEVNEARHFAKEIIGEGQPGRVLNTLDIIAAEDVGLADPTLVKYVGQSYDEFEKWEKESKTKRVDVKNHQEACSIIDQAVIAAALSSKSRLLPMISFATLYDIYESETFDHGLREYQTRFLDAVHQGNEARTLYYAYIIKEVFGEDDSILATIKNMREVRNAELINDWIEVYTRKKKDRNRLLFVGIILLLFRDLNEEQGEYLTEIDRWTSEPIERADIPDRAYDKHTLTGRRKGRGLEHFLEEGASLRNERFSNDWEDAGRKAYFETEKEGIGKTSKIIEAIRRKYEKKD